jgi:hypothetical protein
MALPRPALLGILGAILVLATFVATHKIGKGHSSATQPPAAAQAAHKPAAAKHVAGTPATHAAAPAKPVKHAANHTAVKRSAPVKVNVPAGQEAGAALGLPLDVARAFAKKQVVVLYFGAKGADDSLTAGSVRALKSNAGHGVAVFMDKLSNLADYRRVVEGLNVSEAPSIVIVDRDHKARLYDGFIDAGSLRQYVADVTR